MIKILIFEENPRIFYVCKVIFSCVFQIPYKIYLKEIPLIEKDDFIINYSTISHESQLTIPVSGFLQETEILPERVEEMKTWITAANIAQKNFLHTTNFFSYDIFSAVFFLTSHYEKYIYSFRDQFNRYEDSKYPSAQWELTHTPSVAIWCEQLLAHFSPALQRAILAKRKYDFAFTWDIDHPWKYINKGKERLYLGLIKDLIKGEWTNVQERIQVLLKKRKDPNDTFEEIMRISPPDKTTFFFLLGKGKPHDSVFGAGNRAFQALIQQIFQKGYSVGIHPSFPTYLNPEKIQAEKLSLEKIIQAEVTLSRQHFLRYQFPQTFRYLNAAGIQKDYSLCRVDAIGFPCGMHRPFPWYDLEKEEITDLWLHPAMLMDRSLERYISGSTESKLARVDEVMDWMKKYGGTLTLILHNDSLSESREWKGWSQTIRNILAKVSAE